MKSLLQNLRTFNRMQPGSVGKRLRFLRIGTLCNAGLLLAAHGYSTPSTLEREMPTTYSEKAIYLKVRHVYSLWSDLSSSSKTT